MNAPCVSEDIRLVLEMAGIEAHRATPEAMKSLHGQRGAYLLVIDLRTIVEIHLHRRSASQLPPGTYIYAGSANGPGGLAARVKRHFRSDKKQHWHVDALTLKAQSLSALGVADGHECDLAEYLLRTGRFGIAVEGFGSTDCQRCRSHLLKPL